MRSGIAEEENIAILIAAKKIKISIGIDVCQRRTSDKANIGNPKWIDDRGRVGWSC